jgi:hypothetical protein
MHSASKSIQACTVQCIITRLTAPTLKTRIHPPVSLRLSQMVSLLVESLTWHLVMPREELLLVGLLDAQERATMPGHRSCIWQVGSKGTGN